MQEAKLFKAIALRPTITELSNEDIVRRFFKLIDSRDLDRLLDLFDYDAVVIEPFSKAVKLSGRSEITSFLKVTSLANTNMRRKLELKSNYKTGRVRALVTSEKGDRLRSHFIFDIDPMTKALKIEFLSYSLTALNKRR